MALASAALAFFSRALQASRSRRRFCRSRLSFCRVGDRRVSSPDLAKEPWATGATSGEIRFPGHRAQRRGPSLLTEIVFQSPSRKLRKGVRKLREAV